MPLLPLRTLRTRVRVRQAIRKNVRDKADQAQSIRRLQEQLHSEEFDPSRFVLASWIHPGAGLGHQLSSWISGFLWARDLNVRYSGGALTQDTSGFFSFRGLADGAASPRLQLRSTRGENDPQSIKYLRLQLAKAAGTSSRIEITHARLALDQPRWDQTPAQDVVRDAVLAGALGEHFARAEGTADYIALHVRRGDVTPMLSTGNAAPARWIDESWYANLIADLRTEPSLRDRPVRVYSQGAPSDFPLLRDAGVELHLNGERDLDLIGMAAAYALFAAPSSFSFTAALISRRPILAIHPWWHRIPEDGRWVRVSPEGRFDRLRLRHALNENSAVGIADTSMERPRRKP